MAKTWDEGGLAMPMIKDVIRACKLHWLRRALLNRHKVWAKNFLHDLESVGGYLGLETSINVRNLNKLEKRSHLRKVLQALSELQKRSKETRPE